MKKMTGKVMLVVVLSLVFSLAIACKTTSTSESSSSSKSVFATAEEALKNIYDRFFPSLILDGAEKYTVKSGDTLSNIARSSNYHSGFYYPIIMLASKDVVVDPDKITPGMELVIPDLQKNLDNSRARANIKEFLGEVAKIEDDRGRGSTAQGIRDLANSL